MASEKRRRWFDNPANAAKVVIKKDFVYTWHVWQHWCNISTYRLQLNSLLSFDLCQFSEGQPMQIMCKDQSVSSSSSSISCACLPRDLQQQAVLAPLSRPHACGRLPPRDADWRVQLQPAAVAQAAAVQ